MVSYRKFGLKSIFFGNDPFLNRQLSSQMGRDEYTLIIILGLGAKIKPFRLFNRFQFDENVKETGLFSER